MRIGRHAAAAGFAADAATAGCWARGTGHAAWALDVLGGGQAVVVEEGGGGVVWLLLLLAGV